MYTKEEENILTISCLTGLLVGLPSSLLLSYQAGFFTNVALAADDTIGWTFFYLKLGSIVIPICWGTAIVVCVLLCRRRGLTKTAQKAWKMIFATLLIPLISAYAFLVEGFVFVPINASLAQYVTPSLLMSITALLAFPFMILAGAIVLPDTRAGKALRRYVRWSKRKARKA
jgi:hypothetical protein